MEKKIISIGIILLLLLTFASAGITDYKVTDEVHIGQKVTATGKSVDDSNVPQVNELCSFYFFDENGNLVDRGTDYYTDQTGRFALPEFSINEPEFLRDSNYTLKSVCGSSEEDQNFSVIQRESIAHLGSQEFSYATNQENLDTLFIWGFFIILLIGIVFVFIKIKEAV